MYIAFLRKKSHLCYLILVCQVVMVACEQDIDKSPGQDMEISATTAPGIEINPVESKQTQFYIGNKSYLFDVSNHSFEELEALLERAQEITQATTDDYDDLEIVMILHGPDIDWFTQKNYTKNKSLIELAKKLDENEIIDLKVCETAMDSLGVSRQEVPEFIESVPYAPDEMKRLLKNGYINL